MRTLIVVATVAALTVSTPASAAIDHSDFPTRGQVARILDIDRPGKISVTRSAVDEYFGVVPLQCDLTYNLGAASENRETAYYYPTSTYIIYPSIEVRRYASPAEARARFRDARQRLRDCAGRTYEDPPTAPTGGKVRIETYRPPRIGTATFGLTSSYCCEGGPGKSRIIVSRAGDTIVWTQGLNYGHAPVKMPSDAPYVKLAQLAVRLAG